MCYLTHYMSQKGSFGVLRSLLRKQPPKNTSAVTSCQKAEVSVQCNVPLKSTMSTVLYCLLSEAKPEGCT